MKLSLKLGLFSLCCVAASASTITYTEILANANGVLDGTTFTGQTVTLTLMGDTAGITNPLAGIFENHGPATVSVSGVGTDTFTDTIFVGDSQGSTLAGFVDASTSSDILDIANSAFATYALDTSIGPVSGGTSSVGTDLYNTMGGTFEITSPLNVDHSATFSATGVPEPGTFALMAFGIAGVFLSRRRRQA